MLLGNFFNIYERNTCNNGFNAKLEINALHPIFDGHFPGQPVVPGVCMLQMIKELLQLEAGHAVQLKKAGTMKFLAVINPLENPLINVDLDLENTNGEITVSANFFFAQTTFFKFKGTFTEPGAIAG